MSTGKQILAGISIFIGVLCIVFVFGLFNLGWMKFFNPKIENVHREVFENTQSYTHGKIQDLAKYFDEYNNADLNGKEAVRQIIIMRFAEFDESKINAKKLKNFLVTMRGY